MRIRYGIQLLVMLGDVMLIGCCGIVLYYCHFNIVALVVVAYALRKWWLTGGFEAWTPSGIRAFMTNAKRIGL